MGAGLEQAAGLATATGLALGSGLRTEQAVSQGLGEMPPAQLKETAMDPTKRTLARVTVPAGHNDEEIIEAKETSRLVESLMGRNPEKRFKFIQENAEFVDDLDV